MVHVHESCLLNAISGHPKQRGRLWEVSNLLLDVREENYVLSSTSLRWMHVYCISVPTATARCAVSNDSPPW